MNSNTGSLLINEELTGPELENFCFDGEEIIDENGFRVFKDMNSGTEFLKTEEAIKVQYGEDTYLLALIIWSDKTHVVRSGQIKLWPVYLAVGNFTRDILKLDAAKQLVGYCPELPMHVTSLRADLHEAGISSDDKKDKCITYLKRYFEQEYYKIVLAEVFTKLSARSPVVLEVRSSLNRILASFVPRIFLYSCK